MDELNTTVKPPPKSLSSFKMRAEKHILDQVVNLCSNLLVLSVLRQLVSEMILVLVNDKILSFLC